MILNVTNVLIIVLLAIITRLVQLAWMDLLTIQQLISVNNGVIKQSVQMVIIYSKIKINRKIFFSITKKKKKKNKKDFAIL